MNDRASQQEEQEFETEISQITEATTTELLNRSEIEQQVSTARRFPRSLRNFNVQCREMATLTPQVAAECTYSLPRGKKWITGPSARFAEIVANAWGNCRAGARTIAEEGDFVVAQGAFHDMEKNVSIIYEVRRRIVDKDGERFNVDMVGVTANAACSIALRNAILKGVPKAYWEPAWEAAKKTATGDSASLSENRQQALKICKEIGITPDQVCARLGIEGIADIGIDELIALQGLLTSIKEGEVSAQDIFPERKKNGTIKKEPAASTQANDPGSAPESQEPPKKISESAIKIVNGLAKKRGMKDDELLQFLYGNFNIEGGPANIPADLLDRVCAKIAEKM